ncbi:MAG: hypothetical protein K2N34_14885 [Lachnospiraceae bacterium]|nr:hypothetical protein [Lachnospiraceae bacterium]
MRRLRQRSLQDCSYVKRLPTIKDGEGNTIQQYDIPVKIKAEIWQATSRLQLEMYGLRIANIQNMLYQGNIRIREGDRIVYEEETYNVISKKGRNILIIELEKVI